MSNFGVKGPFQRDRRSCSKRSEKGIVCVEQFGRLEKFVRNGAESRDSKPEVIFFNQCIDALVVKACQLSTGHPTMR